MIETCQSGVMKMTWLNSGAVPFQGGVWLFSIAWKDLALKFSQEKWSIDDPWIYFSPSLGLEIFMETHSSHHLIDSTKNLFLSPHDPWCSLDTHCTHCSHEEMQWWKQTRQPFGRIFQIADETCLLVSFGVLPVRCQSALKKGLQEWWRLQLGTGALGGVQGIVTIVTMYFFPDGNQSI